MANMIENPLTPLRRFQRLLKADKRDITQVYTYALFNGLVNLSLPLGIQAIINLIQGGEVSASWIFLVGLVIVGIALTGILQLLQLRIVENLAQKIFSRSAFEFAYRIPRIQFKSLYDYYAPELANRFFDTLTIQKGLPKILIGFSLALFQIIVGLIVLSLYHPFFILFSIVLVALIYVIMAITGPRGMRSSLTESKYKYAIAYWLEELARTKLSFKLIGNSTLALDETDERVESYLGARESHFRVLVSQFLYLIGFKVIIAAGLLISGGLLVFQQEMNIGQFVAAEIIIILIIASVEKLIQSLDSIYDVLTALEKIGYVTDMPLDLEDGFELDLEEDEGITTSVANLSFHFPGSVDPILDHLNFEVPAGTSVCIMGGSGAGKSTLMQLLSGIFEPTTGVVRYSGIAQRSLCSDTLKTIIGYSLSNNQIFQGTILDNIKVGREDVDLEDLSTASRIVHLHDFINTLPEGLNTPLDPDGKKIPRSVQNKIILARAIVNKPKLLLLEDPLDHVRAEEKEQIIANLTDTKQPWSLIVTSVDEMWLKYIPQSITLQQGRIIHTTLKSA